MLRPVPLTPLQGAELIRAMLDPDSRLRTEDTVNLTTPDGFRATRFLAVPRLAGHGVLPGEEQDADVLLLRGEDAWVIFQQRRAADEIGDGALAPMTVSAHVVLASALAFAPEARADGWPLRIRRLMLELSEWTLAAGRPLLDTTARFPGRPLWEALSDPAAGPVRMFEPDTDRMRQVLAGQTTLRAEWGAWAQDEAAARLEFEACMRWHQLTEDLVLRQNARKETGRM